MRKKTVTLPGFAGNLRFFIKKIAELKFFPDSTWNIEFVYGEIPEGYDDEE